MISWRWPVVVSINNVFRVLPTLLPSSKKSSKMFIFISTEGTQKLQERWTISFSWQRERERKWKESRYLNIFLGWITHDQMSVQQLPLKPILVLTITRVDVDTWTNSRVIFHHGNALETQSERVCESVWYPWFFIFFVCIVLIFQSQTCCVPFFRCSVLCCLEI